MSDQFLTPSKVSAWLQCPHYLTLQSRLDDDSLVVPKSVFGSFAERAMAKGTDS